METLMYIFLTLGIILGIIQIFKRLKIEILAKKNFLIEIEKKTFIKEYINWKPSIILIIIAGLIKFFFLT